MVLPPLVLLTHLNELNNLLSKALVLPTVMLASIWVSSLASMVLNVVRKHLICLDTLTGHTLWSGWCGHILCMPMSCRHMPSCCDYVKSWNAYHVLGGSSSGFLEIVPRESSAGLFLKWVEVSNSLLKPTSGSKASQFQGIYSYENYYHVCWSTTPYYIFDKVGFVCLSTLSFTGLSIVLDLWSLQYFQECQSYPNNTIKLYFHWWKVIYAN